MIGMNTLWLACTVAVGPADWSTTATWLEGIGCNELAVEALLVSPAIAPEARIQVADGLMKMLAWAPTGSPEGMRARLELQRLLEGLDMHWGHLARLALLADDRMLALQAQGPHQRNMLRGAVQASHVAALDLAADIELARDKRQRRALEAIERRVLLIGGLLQVDMGEGHEKGAALLRRALLDGVDPGPLGVASVPSIVLESTDAAWAAMALARIDVQAGHIDAAQAWVDRLVEAHSEAFVEHGAPLVADVLLAMPETIRSDVLQHWQVSLPSAFMLELLGQCSVLQRDVLDVLLARGHRAEAVSVVAQRDCPLPKTHDAVAALAAARRLDDGLCTAQTATVLLEQAVAAAPSDALLQVALARVLLTSGAFWQSLEVALRVHPGDVKPEADAIALLALLKAKSTNDGAADGVLRVLLERMVERGGDAPLRHEAALRLAGLAGTSAQTAFALLDSIPADSQFQEHVARLRERVAWFAWQRSGAHAQTLVLASRDVLNMGGEGAADAADRLLLVLPKAQIDAAQRRVLESRAIQGIEQERGAAHARAAHARLLLSKGLAKQASEVLEQAWIDQLQSESLLHTAQILLAGDVALGPAARVLASRLLGRAPLSIRIDEVTKQRATILEHWARHLADNGVMTMAELEHAASLEVLGQHGLMELGRQASANRRWSLAVRAWAAAARLGGPLGSVCALGQARALEHVDRAAAVDLAGQLAVLHAGTTVGNEAKALQASLLNGVRP